MNALLELSELPSDWKVLPFLDVFYDATSKGIKVKKESYDPEGKLPVVDQGKKMFGGFTCIENKVDIKLPVIVFGDHTKIFKLIDTEFAVGADGVKLLEPKIEADKKFLYFYLNQLQLEDAGYSRHFKFLKETYIPLPPLDTQKKIAAVLEKADQLCKDCQQMEQELNSLAQSVFIELFGDPVTNPKGWEAKLLVSLLKKPLQNGAYYPKEEYSDDGVEMVHMGDVFYDFIPRGNMKRVKATKSDIEKYKLTSSDILISRRSLMLEGAAKPSLIEESDEDLIFESSMIRLTPNTELVNSMYLFYYLSNSSVKQHYIYQYITGATIKGINQTNLEKVEVLVPDINIQNNFLIIERKIRDQKTAQKILLDEYERNFYSLMQQAFKGKLNLTDAPH